jgi:hypothetical protein
LIFWRSFILTCAFNLINLLVLFSQRVKLASIQQKLLNFY